MSPQHPTPDANKEAAATRARGTGSPSSPSTPDEPAPDRGSAPEAGPLNTGPGSGADGPTPPSGAEPDIRKREDPDGEAGTESAPSGPTRAGEIPAASAAEATAPVASAAEAEAEGGAAEGPASDEVGAPGTAEARGTTAPASSAASASTRSSPEARVAVAAAAAVGTVPPSAGTGTGVRSGRPRKPILAGAAVAGAALIAIPLLLTGSARDDGPPESTRELAAGGSDTVLNPTSAPAALDDYVAEKPSPSPKKAKATQSAPTRVAPAQPAAPATQSSPSDKPESKPKAKPKPSPKPDWSTETVSAPSVLEVNQAWTTNRIRMVMQTDGNLVVYNEQRKPIWASMTFGPNHRAIFQPDGNLVIHNGEDRPIWASQTWGHEGAQLVLRADAKVVIVQNGGVIWST